MKTHYENKQDVLNKKTKEANMDFKINVEDALEEEVLDSVSSYENVQFGFK